MEHHLVVGAVMLLSILVCGCDDRYREARSACMDRMAAAGDSIDVAHTRCEELIKMLRENGH